jgi:hypothetical protein
MARFSRAVKHFESLAEVEVVSILQFITVFIRGSVLEELAGF